jgi:glycolate oxidase
VLVAHVPRDGLDPLAAELLAELGEAFLAPPDGHDVPARGVECDGRRSTDAGRRAGDQHLLDLGHVSLLLACCSALNPSTRVRSVTLALMGESPLELFAGFVRSIAGPRAVIDDPAERQAYSCDGLTSHRATPGLVFIPESREQLIAGVRELIRLGIPYVARGAGTGLSGGALPEVDGVLVVLARLRRIVEIDPIARIAVVEPGVVNLELSQATSGMGLLFAPDPSSQIACTIGGNVAENSGGAHCFKYGFTTNHVLGVELVAPTGELVWVGGDTLEAPGLDVRGLLIGSEGTLGIATTVVCRLLPVPEAKRTLVAYFHDVVAAGDAVGRLVLAGVVPAAIEMMDRGAIAACELATNAGLELDWGAALLVELDGPREEVDEGFEVVRAVLQPQATISCECGS